MLPYAQHVIYVYVVAQKGQEVKREAALRFHHKLGAKQQPAIWQKPRPTLPAYPCDKGGRSFSYCPLRHARWILLLHR